MLPLSLIPCHVPSSFSFSTVQSTLIFWRILPFLCVWLSWSWLLSGGLADQIISDSKEGRAGVGGGGWTICGIWTYPVGGSHHLLEETIPVSDVPRKEGDFMVGSPACWKILAICCIALPWWSWLQGRLLLFMLLMLTMSFWAITVPSFARVSTVSFSCRQVCCSGKVDCTQCMTVGSANWRSR